MSDLGLHYLPRTICPKTVSFSMITVYKFKHFDDTSFDKITFSCNIGQILILTSSVLVNIVTER